MKKSINTGHRIIAVILAIMMLLSVMPAVFAAEGDVAQIGNTKYTDLVTALDDACKEENEGCTVKLLNNVSLSDVYEIHSGSFTLDLNGKKIEVKDNDLFRTYGGDITIIDTVGGGSLVARYRTLVSNNSGHLTLGKADGTANSFTVQGNNCSLHGRSDEITIYGGTYIAGSQASIKFSTGYIFEALGEGCILIKKDDPTSVVDGNVDILTESVTVVNAEEFFAPKIISIDGDKPMSNGFSKFTVTLDGHVNKLQVIYPNGSTSTFNNYSNFTTSDNKRGVVSITAYDKDGNEVRPDSSENVREVWVLNLNLANGDYQIKTKSGGKWRAAKKFNVKHDLGAQVDSVTLNGTANGGYNKYSVKVNGSAKKLKVMLPNGGTYTFDRSEKLVTSNLRGIVSIKAYDKNGNEIALGSTDTIYEIWVLNMKLAEGEHTVKAKYKNTWEASGKGFAVSYATTSEEVKVVDVQGNNGSYTFKLNGTAQKLQIVYANGATCTLSKTNSSVRVRYYNANDVEVEKSSDNIAYEIWTVNKKLASGTYNILAKYYNGTTHVWNTIGFAFEA